MGAEARSEADVVEHAAETHRPEGERVRRALAALALGPTLALSACSGCDPETPEAVRSESVATPVESTPPHRTAPAALGRSGPPPAATDPRLVDPDPEVRLEAVEDLEPEEGGLLALIRVVESDPDAAVRAAAVEQMETAESEQALRSLLWALGDPHPEVVLAAVEALEFVGDERIVPELARYRNHPDPEVREALEEAIAFLE